jgi:hypothetical protein
MQNKEAELYVLYKCLNNKRHITYPGNFEKAINKYKQQILIGENTVVLEFVVY